jgi:hypothetical protein
MLSYAFIVPVIATNTGQYRQQVRSLALEVSSKITGVDLDGDGSADRYLLLDVVPEIRAAVWVGWHPNVAENVRDQYTDRQEGDLHQTAFNPPPDPVTEDWMIASLKQSAREHGCEKYWLLRPGDDTTTTGPADLLTRFVDF